MCGSHSIPRSHWKHPERLLSSTCVLGSTSGRLSQGSEMPEERPWSFWFTATVCTTPRSLHGSHEDPSPCLYAAPLAIRALAVEAQFKETLPPGLSSASSGLWPLLSACTGLVLSYALHTTPVQAHTDSYVWAGQQDT